LQVQVRPAAQELLLLSLRKELLAGRSKLAVWGTGYIGFSTIANFAAEGVRCVGTDVSESIVESINNGKMPVPNMEYWLGFDTKYLVTSGTMKATTDWKSVLQPEFAVHMIAIPTEKADKPWDGALEDVITKIATNVEKPEKPPLVIIESTLTPNKTDNLVIPIFNKNGLEVGRDILVGVAPRRDWFISPEKNLKSLPRIVGGSTPDTTQHMIEVLSIVCNKLIPAPDHRHAEIVKSVENAFRHSEITLANQLSLAYPHLNMTEVLRLVGTKWNVGTFHPSFGSGGYCLGGDEYVVAATENKIQFLPIAQLYDNVKLSRTGIVKVLSHHPNERRSTFRKVTAMSRRPAPTMKFTTVGNHDLVATPNHIMYVKKSKRLWKRRASDLRCGEEMPFISDLPYFKPSVNYPPYVRKGRSRRGHVIDLQHFAETADAKIRLGTGSQRLSTGMGRSYQTIPRFIKVDSKLSFLLGLYAAEGCVTSDSGTLRTYLSFNRSEKELIQEAKQTLYSYGIDYIEYDDKLSKAHHIRVSSKIWGDFIREMTGGGSTYSKLPEFLIFWHNRDVRKALLSGLLNGDGHFSRAGTIEFYTKSKVMQEQVVFLARSFGLKPTLNRSRNPPLVRIAGKQARKFAESVFIGDKLAKARDYSNSSNNKKSRGTHSILRPKLKRITSNGSELVYSLEVEKTHNFFTTSGWLVHNCIPLSSKYVLEGAEKPEYLTILKETISTDSTLPRIIADRVAASGMKSVGILGLSYKGDLRVHILSPTLGLAKRLRERNVKVKINDPYYTNDEIRRITEADTFSFPDGLLEFDCILIVAGHRLYKAIPETKLKSHLKKCKLIIDNLEETWKHVDWNGTGIKYFVAGDSNWLN
jgi:nucleotide sugar dehydrogenase